VAARFCVPNQYYVDNISDGRAKYFINNIGNDKFPGNRRCDVESGEESEDGIRL